MSTLYPTRFPAKFLDGLTSGIPDPGIAWIDGCDLHFVADAGPTKSWSVPDVIEVTKVATEVHLELAPQTEDSPTAKLVVLHQDFLRDVDAAQERFGSSGRASIQRTRRRWGLGAWIAIAAVVVPLAYVTYTVAIPKLHVFISVEKEAALGDYVFEAVSDDWDLVVDAEFERVVKGMVQELQAPDSPYDIRVTLIKDELINAMALPGGRIMVYTGLITSAPSADALAGVLAHEVAHVEERHGLKHVMRAIGMLQFAGAAVGGGIDGFEAAETIVELSSGALILKNSRRHEHDADRVGVERLIAAGRSPRGLIEFFETIETEMPKMPDMLQWASTHPLSSERIERVEDLIIEAEGSGGLQHVEKPWMTPEEWSAFQDLFQ